MAHETMTISVNFARAFPVFPLDNVVLLPHAVLRLFIFERRYRQMIESVLDTNGQIAMGVFSGVNWKQHYEGQPPIRGAVCLGQITHHERLPDGNYRIWLQGVCRARVVEESDPDGDRLYRTATLAPIGPADVAENELARHRESVLAMLQSDPLVNIPSVAQLLKDVAHRDNSDDPLPTAALLDVLSLSLISKLATPDTQYRLLEEGDPHERASVIQNELRGYSALLKRANKQFDPTAPGGVTWN